MNHRIRFWDLFPNCLQAGFGLDIGKVFYIKAYCSFTGLLVARVLFVRLKTENTCSRDPKAWRRLNGHGSTEGGAT